MKKEITMVNEEIETTKPYRKCLLERCTKDVSDRLNKKFCSDGHKNEYNNSIKAKELAETRKINLALKLNRRILKRLLGDKPEIIVTEKKLTSAGFNFDFRRIPSPVRRRATHLSSPITMAIIIQCTDTKS